MSSDEKIRLFFNAILGQPEDKRGSFNDILAGQCLSEMSKYKYVAENVIIQNLVRIAIPSMGDISIANRILVVNDVCLILLDLKIQEDIVRAHLHLLLYGGDTHHDTSVDCSINYLTQLNLSQHFIPLLESEWLSDMFSFKRITNKVRELEKAVHSNDASDDLFSIYFQYSGVDDLILGEIIFKAIIRVNNITSIIRFFHIPRTIDLFKAYALIKRVPFYQSHAGWCCFDQSTHTELKIPDLPVKIVLPAIRFSE